MEGYFYYLKNLLKLLGTDVDDKKEKANSKLDNQDGAKK